MCSSWDDLPSLNTQQFSNNIKTLRQLCEESCVNNAFSIFIEQSSNSEMYQRHFRMKDSIEYIPPVFGNTVLNLMIKRKRLGVDDILDIFSNPKKCGIQQVSIRNKQMSFEAVNRFASYQESLAHLKMCSCKIEMCPSIDSLLQLCKEHLKSFDIRHVQCCMFNAQSHIFPTNEDVGLKSLHDLSKRNHGSLKSLRLVKVECAWLMLVNQNDPPSLETLELSEYQHAEAPENVEEIIRLYTGALHGYPNHLLQLYRINSMKATLKSLILHNTKVDDNDLEMIYELENLRFLDLSVSLQNSRGLRITRPKAKLHEIVDRLPNLKSIDVSSTSIGSNVFEDYLNFSPNYRDFWRVFATRKLEYLGLLNCSGTDFPGVYRIANEVSGSFTVVQLITAIERNKDRLPELIYASKFLYQLQYESTPEYNVKAIKVIKLLMEVVSHYPYSEHLLTNLCINIYGLMHLDFCQFNAFQKRELIRLLIKVISPGDQFFNSSSRVIRLALLALEHFNLSVDCVSTFR